VLGAAGAGCAAEGKKVLKIAFASPLTGESAKAGTEMKDAANMAWEEAGYKVGDYTIEPLWVDVTTDPERGALALERAIIRDGAQVVTLSWNSSVVMSLMDVVAKYKIPYYFGHGASAGTLDEKWRSNPEKYSYFIAKGSAKPELLAANAYISVISEAIENGSFKATNRNVAIIGDDTDFGRSIGDAIRDSFVAAGWSKVYEDYFVMGTTDFFAQISKIKASNPSVIGGAISSPASAASFIKQARELGINAVIICDALSENADYYELTGDAVNGVLDSRPAWTEKSKTFEDAFKAKYGYAPSPFNGGHVYDYTHFFIKCCEGAIAKYGALDSETLYKFAQEVLLKGEITYTDGIVIDCYKFTADSAPSPVVGEGYYTFPVLQFMGPVINVVWPASQANAKFQQPQ
jgi:branched-chain amino acid transport system substrate-binding protein